MLKQVQHDVGGKGIQMQYSIKSVPSDNTKELENLLNEMSQEGWDLYSIHEVETEDDFQYNCIFAKTGKSLKEEDEEDLVNISTFKSQMEKMLSPTLSPYESCKEIQEKIREQRKKITKIKAQLEAQSETPISKNRQKLNDEMSQGLENLEELRRDLVKTISPDLMYSKIRQEKLSIQLSEEALDLVNPDLGAVLIAETVKLRQKLVEELGYVIPKIVFEGDEKLNAYEFSIKIRGIEVINSFVYPDYVMYFEDDLKLDKKLKDAIYCMDEITGRKIVWIESKKTKDFWQNGLNPAEFITSLLQHVIIKYIDELFDYSDVNHYMEIVEEDNSFLIENIIPEFISVSELRYILANLLREGISLKDIIYIFEKINDFSGEDSKEDLPEKLRLSLSRYISKKVANTEGIIQVFELSDKTYQTLFGQLDSEENVIRIEGSQVEKIAKALFRKVKKYNLDINKLVILAPIEVRHMLFMILAQFISNIKVIAKEEITSDYTIEILDEI